MQLLQREGIHQPGNMSATNKFDLSKAIDHITTCVEDDKRTLMDSYILTYKELTKFIDLLGTIFGFVNSDINDKLTILTSHRNCPAGEEYTSIQSMVQYEITNKIIETPAELPNGSRSLLRLHRAMAFILGFLEILKENDDVPLTTSVYDCYHKTVGLYHTWLVQKAVGLAVYTLPTKETIMTMLADGRSDEEFSTDLNAMVVKLNHLYSTVQQCYADNEILDLP